MARPRLETAVARDEGPATTLRRGAAFKKDIALGVVKVRCTREERRMKW